MQKLIWVTDPSDFNLFVQTELDVLMTDGFADICLISRNTAYLFTTADGQPINLLDLVWGFGKPIYAKLIDLTNFDGQLEQYKNQVMFGGLGLSLQSKEIVKILAIRDCRQYYLDSAAEIYPNSINLAMFLNNLTLGTVNGRPPRKINMDMDVPQLSYEREEQNIETVCLNIYQTRRQSALTPDLKKRTDIYIGLVNGIQISDRLATINAIRNAAKTSPVKIENIIGILEDINF